ncbi:hypothetical protein M433DRAFT_303009 [Acidomyces richmondensis BFW]|nr:MAG: hypothetical protein FE78DRAFT_455611 [Acidomyces sp. 'richmondensis']KYG44455.1 hypothetical protein M433DRAFT_303009 [Acidomyces richmondensis BFW]
MPVVVFCTWTRAVIVWQPNAEGEKFFTRLECRGSPVLDVILTDLTLIVMCRTFGWALAEKNMMRWMDSSNLSLDKGCQGRPICPGRLPIPPLPPTPPPPPHTPFPRFLRIPTVGQNIISPAQDFHSCRIPCFNILFSPSISSHASEHTHDRFKALIRYGMLVEEIVPHRPSKPERRFGDHLSQFLTGLTT